MSQTCKFHLVEFWSKVGNRCLLQAYEKRAEMYLLTIALDSFTRPMAWAQDPHFPRMDGGRRAVETSCPVENQRMFVFRQ